MIFYAAAHDPHFVAVDHLDLVLETPFAASSARWAELPGERLPFLHETRQTGAVEFSLVSFNDPSDKTPVFWLDPRANVPIRVHAHCRLFVLLNYATCDDLISK